jgi:hypothetical protein
MLSLHIATYPFLLTMLMAFCVAVVALYILGFAIAAVSIAMNIVRALGPLLLGRWVWGFCRIVWTYIFPVFASLGIFFYLVLEAMDRGWITEKEEGQEEVKQVRAGSKRAT